MFANSFFDFKVMAGIMDLSTETNETNGQDLVISNLAAAIAQSFPVSFYVFPFLIILKMISASVNSHSFSAWYEVHICLSYMWIIDFFFEVAPEPMFFLFFYQLFVAW